MTDTQKWQLLAATLVLGFVLWLISPVLAPFALSALFAYLGDPLVDRLERWKLSRTFSVCVVFAAMTIVVAGIALLLVPMLERQVARFIERLPAYFAWFRDTAVPWLVARFGLPADMLDFDPSQVTTLVQQHWREAGGFATTVLKGVSKSGFAILGWVANVLLVPVVTFYLLRDWDAIVARVRELLPRPVEPTISRLARESDSVLGAFLRGQLLVMIALGTIYSIGLWLVGIDLALLIGMIAGLISFVPYLGGIIGLLAAVIAALVQYHDMAHVLLVLLVFGVGQTLEGMVLTPLLVGDRIGLHPVAVIFAVMVGGELFGFLGILLALPVASVVNVVLRHAHERYLASHLYGRDEGAGAGGKIASDVAPTVAPTDAVVPPVPPAAP
ncbi:MAG TPA: AI-2E family transporter [Xanthomonadales bacterium]|nr:AI-2E family transporter [Xanthomonadales bacterium]